MRRACEPESDKERWRSTAVFVRGKRFGRTEGCEKILNAARRGHTVEICTCDAPVAAKLLYTIYIPRTQTHYEHRSKRSTNRRW